jgi:hypothetical protein
MKTQCLVIGAALLAAVSLVSTSCNSPGTAAGGGGGSASSSGSGMSDWWNSPSTQGEVHQIEQYAFQQGLQWLFHLGATSKTREDAIQETVNNIVAQHPDAPRAGVEKAVRSQFRKAAAQKAKQKPEARRDKPEKASLEVSG